MPKKAIAGQQMETDVIIVGYGGAGAAAAISAHDSGAQVIILEKMAAGGGNSLASSNGILIPTDMKAVQYFKAIYAGNTGRDIVQTFIKNGLTVENWIHELGSETESHSSSNMIFPRLPLPSWEKAPGGKFVARINLKSSASIGLHSDSIHSAEGSHKTEVRKPGSLWQLLAANVKRRGITVMTSTPAKELVMKDGEITGVIAERNREKVKIKAKRGVILTCGGFEYNEAMKQTFLPCSPFYCFGSPGNTGDGIIMAQKVGADLWHMSSLFGPLAFKAPEFEAGFGIKVSCERFILVDRDGKRFTNETALKIHDMWRAVSCYDPETQRYPRIPSYCVFDDITRQKGPLYSGAGVNRNYEWSSDNSREVARGWISREDTIRKLAKRMSLDENTLEHTVNKYNEYCKVGVDSDFGRDKELLGPIKTPPFYAIQLWPGLHSTHGGPRRDKEARVLNTEGKPVPRLYSAGELGALSSVQYEAGTDLCECLVFGRIAGQNAASEKPWC